MPSCSTQREQVKTIEVTGRRVPPNWAVRQRHLMDQMDRAAVAFVERYTRSDGSLIWRKEWPGMDGSDDGYESFLSFPLFYILGGGEYVHELARWEWDAITRQFTEYGQVFREFDAYYDWMHHGESYTYIYYLGLADPHLAVDRGRALRFAGMYTGEDPEAPNWDPDRKMIRSPINGSRGPRLLMSGEDWVTHRPVLAHYLSPYEDVPGIDGHDPFAVADWNDDETFSKVLQLMNERMVPGDVPLNLTATSLVTNAFLYTGEEKYWEWVLDYVQAWMDRRDRNNGVIPDNVGPSDRAGERMDGKWWGGYYGWRWPHGATNILQSTLIAGCNAVLLTGDASWLDLHRSQVDLLWSHRREADGKTVVPVRHGDSGWFDYRPPDPGLCVYLYSATWSEEDLDRLESRCPDREGWRGEPRFGKAGSHAPMAWYAYLEGMNPGFPDKVLDDTYAGISRRLEAVEADTWNVEEWGVHHWQNLNPVLPEGLIQMALGTPAAVYYGGLLHATVRYFDPSRRRPGLPPHVAALVEEVAEGGATVLLVNLDALDAQTALIQAGTFGEHRFTEARFDTGTDREQESVSVESSWLQVRLGPSARARLRLGLKRHVRTPSYNFPPFAACPPGDSHAGWRARASGEGEE